jgi:hypothetical protein
MRLESAGFRYRSTEETNLKRCLRSLRVWADGSHHRIPFPLTLFIPEKAISLSKEVLS